MSFLIGSSRCLISEISMFIFFNVLTDHNHNKYITTPEFNKFTVEVVDAKSAKANLIIKTDFDTKLINIEKPANI